MTSCENFLYEHKNDILNFGELFVEKLGDRELMEALAQKDMEKMARLFKLLMELLDCAEPKSSSPALEAIISAIREDENGE